MTPTPRRRVRIGRGLFRDQWGIAAIVKVGKVQREQRFPLDTPDDELKAWQAETRAALYQAQRHEPAPLPGQAKPQRGTIQTDGDRYLALRQGRPSFKADRSHMRAWQAMYGPIRRAYLKPSDVARAIADWQAEGFRPQTIIHRCRVLRHMYQTLDGAKAKPPFEGVTRPTKPRPVPTTVPVQTIVSTLDKLERLEPAMAARFRILALTGQRPTQLMRTSVQDVNLKRGIWMVPAAKLGHTRELFLNPDMRAAWKTLIKLDALGEYDTSRMAKLLRQCGWPKGIRPYNVRHSFAVDALERGVDLGDLQGLLGHSEIETTRAYYAPILQARLKVASGKMTGRLTSKRR